MFKITPFYNNSDKIYYFLPNGNELEKDDYVIVETERGQQFGIICSTDIIMIPGNTGAYGSGNNIQIGLTSFSAVLVHRYLCCNCGYSEEWINKKDIPTLKKKFQSK